MKKHFIILFFGLIIISAYTAETWLSAEYQYGFYFLKGEHLIDIIADKNDKYFKIGKNGMNIKTYTFWNNQNIGLFTKTGLSFPYSNNNYQKNYQFNNIVIPLSFGSGVGFRHSPSDKSSIYCAVGFNLNFYLVFAKSKNLRYLKSTNRKSYGHEFVFSLISDIGYKYNINNNVYLNVGTNLDFGFAKHIKHISPAESFYPEYSIKYSTTSKWAKGSFSFEFMPYIGVGFIIE